MFMLSAVRSCGGRIAIYAQKRIKLKYVAASFGFMNNNRNWRIINKLILLKSIIKKYLMTFTQQSVQHVEGGSMMFINMFLRQSQ